MQVSRRVAALAAACLWLLPQLGAAPTQEAAEVQDPQNTIVITLQSGDVVIELLPDVAPQHVERIKTLANAGEYDGVVFHRVIEGFMAQTGDVQYGRMGQDMRYAGRGGSGVRG